MEQSSRCGPVSSRALLKHDSMDAPAKRLTKEQPPPSMQSARSLRAQSSGTLKKYPSAPSYPQPSNPAQSDHPHTYSTHTSSNSSLDVPSPSVASTEFGSHGQTGSYSNPYRSSLTGSYEIISGPEDNSLSKTLDNARTPSSQYSPRRPPLPPSYTAPDPRMLTPSLRQSASFSIGDRGVDLTPPRADSALTTSSKRYSDDANGGKTRWRKKSGISGFVNSVLGSPRNVKIGAPENPIHMIHVGYDNETGQFTVRLNCLCV